MRETFKKFTCNVLLLCPFEKTNRTNNSNKIKKKQSRWDARKDDEAFHDIQKSIKVKNVITENRMEDKLINRMIFDHTGLNGTMFSFAER